MKQNYDKHTNKYYPKKKRKQTKGNDLDRYTDQWYKNLALRRWSTRWPRRNADELLKQIQSIPRGVQTSSELLDVISYCIIRAKNTHDVYNSLDGEEALRIWKEVTGVNYDHFEPYLKAAAQVAKITAVYSQYDPGIGYSWKTKYKIPRSSLKLRGDVFKAFMKKNAGQYYKDVFAFACFEGIMLPYYYPSTEEYPQFRKDLQGWLSTCWHFSKTGEKEHIPPTSLLLDIGSIANLDAHFASRFFLLAGGELILYLSQ